jgi:hypothetical protein
MQRRTPPRGKSRESRQLAPDHPHGMQEGQPAGVFISLQGRLVHQPAPRVVRQQQAQTS